MGGTRGTRAAAQDVDGRPWTLSCHIISRRSPTGEPVGATCFMQDVVERRAAENASAMKMVAEAASQAKTMQLRVLVPRAENASAMKMVAEAASQAKTMQLACLCHEVKTWGLTWAAENASAMKMVAEAASQAKTHAAGMLVRRGVECDGGRGRSWHACPPCSWHACPPCSWHACPPCSWHACPPCSWHACPPCSWHACPPMQLACLSPMQLACLFPHAAGMPVSHAAGMPVPMQLACLSPMQLACLSPMQLACLSPMQLGMPFPHAAGMPFPHAAGMPAPHASLPSTPFPFLHPRMHTPCMPRLISPQCVSLPTQPTLPCLHPLPPHHHPASSPRIITRIITPAIITPHQSPASSPHIITPHHHPHHHPASSPRTSHHHPASSPRIITSASSPRIITRIITPHHPTAIITPASSPASSPPQSSPRIITPHHTPHHHPASSPRIITPHHHPASSPRIITPHHHPASSPRIITPHHHPASSPRIITPHHHPASSPRIITPHHHPASSPPSSPRIITPHHHPASSPRIITPHHHPHHHPHQIRNPLNGILSSISFMEGTEMSSDQRDLLHATSACGKYLRRVVDNVLDLSKLEKGKLEVESRLAPKYLRRVVDNVLDLSKLEEGKLEVESEPFELIHVVDAVIAQEHENAGNDKGLQVFCSVKPQCADVIVKGDKQRVQQIVANFLSLSRYPPPSPPQLPSPSPLPLFARPLFFSHLSGPFYPRQEHENAGDKGLQVFCSVEPQCADVIVKGDKHRVQQIVANFFRNAVEYTQQGWIEVQLYKASGEVASKEYGRDALAGRLVPGQQTGQRTGQGRKPAPLPQQDQAWDLSSSSAPAGSGLGLIVSQKLASLMHGTLSCDSTLSQGSSFRLSLSLPFAGRSNHADPADAGADMAAGHASLAPGGMMSCYLSNRVKGVVYSSVGVWSSAEEIAAAPVVPPSLSRSLPASLSTPTGTAAGAAAAGRVQTGPGLSGAGLSGGAHVTAGMAGMTLTGAPSRGEPLTFSMRSLRLAVPQAAATTAPVVELAADVAEATSAVEELPLQSAEDIKAARKEEQRRKRLVQKRKLRKKGRWPPSKMKQHQNV
ncbi:unnamed protein product [Closterium sp. NIES-65]|nr:unnamed protein product [Closterium sp. NIES-65]